MTKFTDCFWGTDFNSTAGFDALCKRLKDGKQMCLDFEDFIRQRADAEEKYGKALMRLAENAKGRDEIGTLRESWEVIKTETENIGKLHLALSKQLIEELESCVRKFREMQRDKRKKVEESVKRAQRNKKNCFDLTSRLKKTYEQKCHDVGLAEEALQRSVSLASKDEEKLRVKLGRAKTAVEQADTAYQNSVRSLEDARVMWEKEMEQCCNLFQTLEEERISFLRNAMWAYANTSSMNCVKVDETCEEMRKSLENCAVESDIHLFVSMKKTGSDRPVRIEYENYYMAQSSAKVVSPSSNVNITGPVAGTFVHSKDTNIVQPSVGTPKSLNRRPPMQLPNIPHQESLDESMYSSVDQKQQPIKQNEAKFYRAAFDYDAQGDQEISFKAGDHIKLIYHEDDTWWCGEVQGKRGMFPKDFVEEINP
ncbi:proline-serine-threonine phosphatase-interacting protein 1-like [Pocillopora damicornis]|uniref:proline-serine-threonine phosphatase-interacting protein 1-like n=1 Tax=Pocillopora damicornis TaxID=46731 RepID=UPI000F54CE97|nr:proline-serine-threonine phosphatase-interacting protein 1-like [Pocillopora damicornis]